MSTPSPKVIQRVIDNTQAVPDLLGGIVFVQGITERGPINDPSKLITSWSNFQNLFGGLIENSDFPLHCKIMLDRGCMLRVNSIKLNALKSKITLTNDEEVEPDDLFTLASKYPGKAYNFDDEGDILGLRVTTHEPSDDELGDFNMNVYFEGNLVETYENLKVNEIKLSQALANSRWIELDSVEDLTVITNNLFPDFTEWDFDNGSDGDLVTDTELSNFSPFDDYEDSFCLIAPDEHSTVIHTAGVTYAELRGDIRYYGSIPTSDDEGVIITARKELPYSKYASYTSGGFKIFDPLTGTIKNISEVSNFVANFIQVAFTQNLWFSFSGPNSSVPGVLGPVNNFGGKSKSTELDLLNRNHVNMAINRGGVNMFWGNFTAQRENTHLKFISTHNLIIFIGKTLGPTLETFIEKPLDLQLFGEIFQVVRPFLEGLVAGRAIFSYDWQGDQNAPNIDSLQVNDPSDIQMGKYKINLPITRINPLQEIRLTIELTRAGVTIE